MPEQAAEGVTMPALVSSDEIRAKSKRSDANRKSYAADTSKAITHQLDEISQLKRDNERLKKEWAVAQSAPYGGRQGAGMPVIQTGNAGRRIQKVKEMDVTKETIESMEHQIGAEQSRSEELEGRLSAMRTRIHGAREKMGGVNVTKEGTQLIGNQVHVLENRLDKALVDFNEALHTNKELREQIDSLRRERSVFDTIYKKLERELQEKKKEMAFIIEVSNIAYEERDNAQSELGQLKVYAAKEIHSFEETFKELDDLLEEDRRMKEAIKTRMAERPRDALKTSVLDDDLKKPKKSAPMKTTGPTAVSSSPADGAEMTHESYEDAFQKIKAATHITDINLLVNRFLHSEDDNFSLFNYVNELNNEIEKLEEGRNEIRREIEAVKGQGGQGDAQRRALLKQLEDQLQVEEAGGRKFQQLTGTTGAQLEQIIVCVDKLFTTLECDEGKIVEQLGTAGLSENTLPAYLATMEVRTEELLLRWRQMTGTADRGPGVPYGQSQITIDMPSTGDDFNDGYSDEEEKVLTRSELLMKTNQKLFKQQAAAADGKKGKRGPAKKKAPMFPPATRDGT